MFLLLFTYFSSVFPKYVHSYYFDHLTTSPFPNDNTYGYAVDYQDYDGEVTPAKLGCLKSSTYDLILVGVFRPVSNGIFDPNAVQTIKMALDAGLRVEVYMHVLHVSDLSGSQQLELVVNGLGAEGIRVKTIWLMVTEQTHNESRWSSFNQTANILFLSDIFSKADEHGITVGIYTNSDDWARIVGKRGSADSDVPLWYYNVMKHGIEGETDHNFLDFIQFGPFMKPTLKQFAHRETLCELTVSRNVYRRDTLLKDSFSRRSLNETVIGGNFNI